MSRAAIRYAKAILQHANETNATQTVLEDMMTVHSTLSDSKELRLMLKSPIVKSQDKKEALEKIFSDQSSATKGLIDMLVANNRASLLGGVAEGFIHLYNESRGVKIAEVTTAVPLTTELEQKVLLKVKEMTGSESVTIENTIDESIIGGFILRVGDLQFNASIANKLGSIKREFSKSL